MPTKQNATGQLKHRGTIQFKKKTRDSFGAETISWVDDATCWMAIMPLRGNEYFASQQIQASVTHRIRMRYQKLADNTRINPNCRIKFDDRFFNIQSVVNPEETNVWLDLMCVEETDAG